MRPDRRFRQLGLVAILISVAITAQGCQDDTYTACAKATKDISDTVKTGIDVVQTLYTSTSDIHIDKAERDGALGVLSNLTDLNIEFRSQVKTLHANPTAIKADYLRMASSFVSSAQGLLASGALHVKNEKAQTRLNTVFETIKTALNGVTLAIQNAKGA